MKKVLLVAFIMASLAVNAESVSKENLIMIDGGTFNMGSKSGDEKPIHEVKLDSYYIGKYEITQKEFESVMGFNPSGFKGEKNPVEQISWYDAVLFCNEASKKDGMEPYYTIEVKEKNKNGNIIDGVVIIKGGKGYRLPTEAEWEYAAKGGSKSKGFRFSGSDNADEVSWYNLNSASRTHAVGEKLPNELGIYDMSGNVWEWCWDWYGKNYYSKSPVENPTGPDTGNKHIERGGCWSDNNTDSRSSYRGNGEPFNIFTAIGFRVVKGI